MAQSSFVFAGAFWALLASFLIGTAGAATSRRALSRAAQILMWVGAATLALGLGLRWHEADHAPWSNLYESLVLASLATLIAFLVLARGQAGRGVAFLVTPIPLIALGYASLLPADSQTVTPLVPVLRSRWLVVHVLTVILSYGAFALAAAAALGFLLKARPDGSIRPGRLLAALPEPDHLDGAVYRAIAAGFPLLTFGIITGAAWANISWGSYWSWDPKETWSLVTWLVYAGYLHLRLVSGWRGRRNAWIALAGFAAVLFTYLGVSFLLPGLHSYATVSS